MREVSVTAVRDTIAKLCIQANNVLPSDLVGFIDNAVNAETNTLAKTVLCDIRRNIDAAKQSGLPICQDTGMAVVFFNVGQDVHFVNGDLKQAVNDGVKIGYEQGLLRKSIVADPIRRGNTGDNTPAVVHIDIVKGDKVFITVAPKGFGSENMSSIKMLKPSQSRQGVIDTVLEVVKKAASNPCPPITVGVGIGSDFEGCAILSKKALCRNGNIRNSDPYYALLEEELLGEINKTGIGPQGFGGDTTALYVNIEAAPTHIAGLPVAVNIGCHVTRHASAEV